MGTQVGGGTPEATATDVGGTPPAAAPRMAHASWPVWVAMAFFLLFVLLSTLMVTGITQQWDSSIIHRLRPLDRWGESQERWIPWMSRFKPSRTYSLLVVTSLAMSLWRRSWWPLVFGLALAGTSIALTVLVKFALGRGDPHGYVTTTGGSYPSGHTVAVVVGLGGCLLLVWPRVHWWLWAPVAAATGLMAAALLVSAVHWPTDVLGGVLLALAVVSAASRLSWRRRACRPATSPWFDHRRDRRR